jgi:hypothetical protein
MFARELVLDQFVLKSSERKQMRLGKHLLQTIFCTTMTMVGAAFSQEIKATTSEGWDIFVPRKGDGHRYGPSIIINADKSVDMWLASTGGAGTWDWIRHRHSVDGGKTWGTETVVLKPTKDSQDRMSVCDPGVIKVGDYYYLGVTAVYDDKGRHNHVFVARSQSPTGPFEKWDGHGWGGAPQAIIRFAGSKDAWGAGEPSFVVHDQLLFIYYTWTNSPAFAEGEKPVNVINQIRVATAPANDPNWPGQTTERGIAFECIRGKEEGGEGAADVKYCPALHRFFAISIAGHFTDSSYVALRTSTDGFTFSAPLRITENIKRWGHNIGISGTAEGHFHPDDMNFISYAYSADGGLSWGFWHTFLNPIAIHTISGKE